MDKVKDFTRVLIFLTSLLHGARPFFRSHASLRYSVSSDTFTESGGSLQYYSQVSTNGHYPAPPESTEYRAVSCIGLRSIMPAYCTSKQRRSKACTKHNIFQKEFFDPVTDTHSLCNALQMWTGDLHLGNQQRIKFIHFRRHAQLDLFMYKLMK
jgi:hypothetical protein